MQTKKIVNIEEVEYEEPIPVYCLEIDTDTHAFILENGIITHNCEGLSAVGSLKAGRNAKNQALLPIRGKLKSVYKVSNEEALSSELIKNIIQLVGTGINNKNEKCNVDNRNFDKIVFACFTGDTEVFMLDGTVKTFEELVELEKENPDRDYWVYSVNENGQFVPGCAKHPRITQYTDKIAHVILDNGKEIKCTPDHLFMDRFGNWIEAQNLVKGTSLMPLYFKYNEKKAFNHKRQMYLDNVTDKWEFTHMTVFDHFNEYKGTGWHRHHIDDNYLNNEPTNLEQVEGKKHILEHSRQHMIKYNKSEAHRKIASELGKIYGPINLTKYNKSEAHKEAATRVGRIYGPKNMTRYNKSEKHREVVRQQNRDKKMRKLQKRGKVARTLSTLLATGYELNENDFNEFFSIYYIPYPANNWTDLTALFDENEDLYEIAKQREPYKAVRREEREYPSSQRILRMKVANVVNRILLDGKKLTDATYKEYKSQTTPTLKYAYANLFDNEDKLLEFVKTFNHMVKDVWIEDVPLTPMYDFTVDTYHNFVTPADTNSGIVVHQCDKDVDASHIDALLLSVFYKFMPEMIIEGHVYNLITPLYENTMKNGNIETTYSEDEQIKFLKENRPNVKKIQRNKGLGELTAETMAKCMNPETRHLIQYTMEDAEKAKEAMEIFMGDNPDLRKDVVLENLAKYVSEE